MVILPVQVTTAASEGPLSRTRGLIVELLRRCGRLAGFQGRGDEEQVMTLLPSKIRCTEDCVEVSMMALAKPERIFISSEERVLIVEARLLEEHRQETAGATVHERVDKRFTRTFELPWSIRANSVSAELTGCRLIVRAARL